MLSHQFFKKLHVLYEPDIIFAMFGQVNSSCIIIMYVNPKTGFNSFIDKALNKSLKGIFFRTQNRI